mgnify:CR=1 FL=1
MKQMTFADAEYAGKRKQTRKELFLIEMDRVVPWKGLIALIDPHYPKGEGGRPAYPLMAMLRVHLMQNWFGYSDPAMEEALYETTILRQFAGLSLERIPDETTILNFRRLLKKHDIDFEVLTAGEYKRTLTVFGENTEKGREKFQEDLDTTHELFKNFVARYRPQLNIDEIATGEVWLGVSALNKHLVDELKTSDEYLAERAREAELFHLHFAEKKSLPERFGLATSVTLDRLLLNWWSRLNQQRFW